MVGSIFCTLPVFSDWAGMIGLGIGTASLILTLFTFWKVKTIQEVVDELQNRNLLRTRLPEILSELIGISDNLYSLYISGSTPCMDAQIQREANTVRAYCSSIKRYIKGFDEIGFPALHELSTFLERQTTIFDASFYGRYRHLLDHFIAEMKIFQKEMEVRIP